MKRDAAREDRAAAAGIDTDAYLTLACSRAGLGSWPEALQSMRGGAILRLAFARRRPAGFMHAFAALLRHERLQLRATGSLDLYLGTPAGLAALDAGHPGELAELTVGAVEPDDTTVALSAPARSAGVRQGKHQRRAARPTPSAS